MLLNNFFRILMCEPMAGQEGKFKAVLGLNEKHPIYGGHFPGMPVTPGVCLVQMVKETAGFILKKRLMMGKADQMKFIAIVNPHVNPELTLELSLKPLENGQIHCESVAYHDKTVFFKIKAVYQVIH